MTQLQTNRLKLFKALKVKSKREYLELDNSFEIIEKAIIKLYNLEISNNFKLTKPLKHSSIYQKYFKSIRAHSRDIGKPLSFKINKTPKNPQNLMKGLDQLKPLNIDTKPIKEIHDYNKIFTEIREFMKILKTKSLKWYNFLLVKICSGLDYTDITELRVNDLKEIQGYCIISKYRSKTECENFSVLSNKATIELKDYIRNTFYSNLNGKIPPFKYITDDALLFPSNDHKIVQSNKRMNSESVSKTIKSLMKSYFPSKKLRAITNQILNEFGTLGVLERDFYSKMWLGHKIQTHNIYTDKLRIPKYFISEYFDNYEKFFNQLF